jgi:hypothetical protein
MIIPKEFIVGGIKYNVSFVDHTKDIDYNLGIHSGLTHEIKIAKQTTYEDREIKIPDDEVLLTYLHELGHCFGYYFNGDSSEELACAFSNFFYEYLLTKK